MGLRTWVKERLFRNAKTSEITGLQTDDMVGKYTTETSPTPVIPVESMALHNTDEQVIDTSVDRNAELAVQWFESGLEKAVQGDMLGSIQDWEKAIEIKSDYHQAWYNRGVFLAALGRYEEAIESYEKAIEFKPDKHEAWFKNGISLYALGRYQEALDSYEKAIEFDPDSYEAWSNRGNSLDDLGRYEGKPSRGLALGE